jgi:hypothetical protein
MKVNKQVSAILIATLLAGGVATTVSAQNNDAREERRAEMFSQLDTNGDGSISAEEFANPPSRFAQADTNDDGLLSAEEIAAAGQSRAEDRAERMIARMDTNGDGMLSEDEIGQRRDGARMFDRLDANDDGVVSAEEFAEARMGDRAGRRDGDRGGFFGSKRHGHR